MVQTYLFISAYFNLYGDEQYIYPSSIIICWPEVKTVINGVKHFYTIWNLRVGTVEAYCTPLKDE